MLCGCADAGNTAYLSLHLVPNASIKGGAGRERAMELLLGNCADSVDCAPPGQISSNIAQMCNPG